jgi:hypothetical protein
MRNEKKPAAWSEGRTDPSVVSTGDRNVPRDEVRGSVPRDSTRPDADAPLEDEFDDADGGTDDDGDAAAGPDARAVLGEPNAPDGEDSHNHYEGKQLYPKAIYGKNKDGVVVSRLVQSRADHDQVLKESPDMGWTNTPAELGLETHPTAAPVPVTPVLHQNPNRAQAPNPPAVAPAPSPQEQAAAANRSETPAEPSGSAK